MLFFTVQLLFSAKLFSLSPPPPKKSSTREREYLRLSEVQAMIGAAKKVGRHGVRDSAIILLMFRHGLRTAELVALKWVQIDLVGGYIEIHRVKNGHDTIHPLRSPELNPIERLWRRGASPLGQALKQDLKWELFSNWDELHCFLDRALKKLTPKFIASVCGYSFILDALSVANIY